MSIAYGSGLRREEILHLTWADVDFDNRQIRVTAKIKTDNTLEWEPKDRENRVVPMTNETEQLLAKFQIEAAEGHPYIFISAQRLIRIKEHQKKGSWKPNSEVINNVCRDFNGIRRKAGVKKCTLHDFRRSAITNWAQKLPIQVVQQLAGHSDISTTRKYYLSVRSEDLTSASEVLNNLLLIRSRRLTPK